MAQCLRIRLPQPRPPGSTAPIDRDLLAAVLAQPALDYFGDDSNVAVTAGKVTAWGNRTGGAGFAQANVAQELDWHEDGGLANRGWMEASGFADATGDRMLYGGPVLAATAPRTYVDIVSTYDLTATRYLDGAISGNDSLAGYVSAAGGGSVNQRFGNATATLPIALNNWTVVVRSIDGLGQVEIQTYDCAIDAPPARHAPAAATIQPTTARAWTLGATSTLGNVGLWRGGWPLRIRVGLWIGGNRAWFHDDLGAWLKSRYQLARNPIALV